MTEDDTFTEDVYMQKETPTTRILKSRNDKRVVSDGKFRYRASKYPDSWKPKEAACELRTIADIIEDLTEDTRLSVTLTIEEVAENKRGV